VYNDKKILAVITARGGSKRLLRKNIRLLSGKPLIAWTIEEGKKSKYIDSLILSSEDEEIIDIAKKWRCEVPFVRNLELSKDNVPAAEPVLHALDMLKHKQYDYVVLLQPTSPLRTAVDIDESLALCINSRSPACISVTLIDKHKHLFNMYKRDIVGKLQPVDKRQNRVYKKKDLPEMVFVNGAIFVAEIEWFKKNKTFITYETNSYIMPNERSIDIDTDYEFKLAECMLQTR